MFQIFLCGLVYSMKYTDFDALFSFELKYVKIAIETSLNHELFLNLCVAESVEIICCVLAL